MSFHKITVAAALVAAAISAQAADIQIYGRVDEGLRFTHKHNSADSDTFEVYSGNRATNRFGFNIVEDISPTLKAKVYLENGFKSDTGEMGSDGVLFDRRSILALQGSFGEVGAGRMGTVQSTVAPYSMGLLKWDPFATSYSQASIGTTFANTARLNNSLTWISPSMAGWRLGATYSLGDTADDDADFCQEYADRDHTLALAADYSSENMYFSVTYANVQYGNKEGANEGGQTPLKDDGNLFGFGGWYQVTPAVRGYFGAQYQMHWDSAAGVSTSKIENDDYRKENDDEKETWRSDDLRSGFDGYSLLLGATYTLGNHKFLGDVQFFDGELSDDSSMDYKVTVLGLAYEYKLAKTTWFYVAATNTWKSGKVEQYGEQSCTELMTGINWNF